MPALKNPKHELFCHQRAKGVCADKAYVSAGYKEDRHHAARLATNGHVIARVAEIQKASETATHLTIAEKRQFLADVLRTPLGDVDQTSPLCQEHSRTDGEMSSTIRFKMPCKLKAIQLDNDLAVDGAEAGKNKAIEIVIRKL